MSSCQSSRSNIYMILKLNVFTYVNLSGMGNFFYELKDIKVPILNHYFLKRHYFFGFKLIFIVF